MCELQLTVGIMSCTALLTTLCVKGGTHPLLWRRIGHNGLPIAFPEKWPYDLPMNRVWSGRRGFEADLNRFALIPQVHRTQPCDDLHQQAVIRPRSAGGVDPIDDLGVCHHTSAAALKEDFQETIQAHFHGEEAKEYGHERRQRVL